MEVLGIDDGRVLERDEAAKRFKGIARPGVRERVVCATCYVVGLGTGEGIAA